MPDPLFDSRTPRFDLPLLFAGQAQKEIFINEIAARIDALLHIAVEAEQSTPPVSPSDGQAWLVGTSASGEWSGKSGHLALRQSGNWLFAEPRDGMRLLNRSTGQEIRFANGWQAPGRPVAPTGGSTVDAEARTTIAALLACLTTAGVIPPV